MCWFCRKIPLTKTMPVGLKPIAMHQLKERTYSIYSQKDPRWASTKLGNGKLLMGDYGCLVCSIAMIVNKPPYIVNQLLTENKGFTKGSKVVWSVVEELFELEYTYFPELQSKMCIAETNHYAPKFKQHFFLLLEDGRIVDPADDEPIEKDCPYKIVSYRGLNHA